MVGVTRKDLNKESKRHRNKRTKESEVGNIGFNVVEIGRSEGIRSALKTDRKGPS